MKIFGIIILIAIVVTAVAKDRASFRVLAMILPSYEMNKIYFHCLIPGYATWKLVQVRKEIFNESKSENNPKRG